ncbi:uncharacterized protein H6S33_000354 [Morchella sextelata]|uniref:uncharacterized protein n=1 Tax=Morchella sextelata TaxID=1174677 RepID=UPI001D03D1C1|nr:uncharacterized protein H6S33_000354 [Morchella sextelata]KAH0614718.1 hypothetical protein H6S33_000354 [Morchella sextelata]
MTLTRRSNSPPSGFRDYQKNPLKTKACHHNGEIRGKTESPISFGAISLIHTYRKSSMRPGAEWFYRAFLIELSLNVIACSTKGGNGLVKRSSLGQNGVLRETPFAEKNLR